MNNEKYLELIACFMIGLVLTIPFYVSSVMAQESDDEIPDATQACIEKNEETSGLADLMESGVIDYIEKILQMLHAVSTIWESVKFIWNGVIIVLYDTIFGSYEAKAMELEIHILENPASSAGAKVMHYLVTCETDIKLSVCNIKSPSGKSKLVGPFENIYTAIACFCIPGILFQLRQLAEIYKIHDCCIEEACSNGVSVENCEREFSIAECMFWGKGALIGMVFSVLTNLIFDLIFESLITEYVSELPTYVGTIVSLGRGAFKISSLISAVKRMQNVFSEPDCKDFGFGDVQDEIANRYTQQNCDFRPVDVNGDGIFDKMDNVCSSQSSSFFGNDD